MKIIAKMLVQEVTQKAYSYGGPLEEEVKLSAIYDSANPEDNSFAKATPRATLTMTIDNPEARGILQAGRQFYVEFTRVKDAAPAPTGT